MRLSYKMQNVLGSTFSGGSLHFFPDGNRLLSPIGNKILMFDIKNGRSESLPFEIEYNFNHLSISLNANLLLASSQKTHLYMISLLSGSVLHRKEYKRIGEKINDLKFSEDSRFYAVCGDNQVLVYLTPGFGLKGSGRQVSPFKLQKIIKGSFDDLCCISWSRDSRLLAVGSKDFAIRIFSMERNLMNVSECVYLTGHSDCITNCFFANSRENQLNVYSLSRNNQIFVWAANYSTFAQLATPDDEHELLNYRKEKRYFFNDDLKSKFSSTCLSAACFNSDLNLLVVGFSNGSFLLYEMPEITLIHSLQLSNNSAIDSLAINPSGDWIAIGSGISSGNKYDLDSETTSQSQLIVWEWQSESFILKQTGYSSGVTNVCECIAYSPDATHLASGGTDGKIKIWNMFSGFCISTFAEEHKGPITAIEFVPGKDGKVLLSASLDGTVRAFDLNRYRNFRTLAAPSESKPAQFICVAVDSLGGDFVAAGAHNFFEIFLWSLQTGRLLECLTGHEGPVSGLSFSPTSNSLVSCSWDCTVRIWELFEGSKCSREVIKLGSDAMSIAFRADGGQFAVSTLNGNICFFDPRSAQQLGAGIEGKDDLGTSQSEQDLSRDRDKYFHTIHYSVDGNYIITAGKSKYVCIYHVSEKLLVKRFTITWNLSMDGMYDFINKRKVAEFGFNLALIKKRNEDSDFAPISLPGVSKSDFSSRSVNPLIAVFSVRFSPTMRTFAVASTEGIIIYSLDHNKTFDPFQLEAHISPASIKSSLNSKHFNDALMMALKLNEKDLIQEVIESVPIEEISFICNHLPISYVEKCLKSIALGLESTRHVEFYLKWCNIILNSHGVSLKNNISSQVLLPTLFLLQQNLTRIFESIGKVCEHNKYLLRFIKTLSHHKDKHTNSDDDEINEDVLI